MTLSDTVQCILDAATADPSAGVPGLAFTAVDKNGAILAANASGKRGPSNQEAMTLDTVVWLASCTKLITAIAALQLVEQEKLHLDDTEEVRRLYPEIADIKRLDQHGNIIKRSRHISLRMLLTHTAGFAYPFSDGRIKSFAIKDQHVIFEPGTGWVYSLGLDYVGVLIERITGVTLEQYFQENILKPLGMEDFGFWISQRMKAKLSNLYLRRQSDGAMAVIPHKEPAALEDPGTKVKCGGGDGCFGSVQEYSKVLAALLNNGISPSTGEQILKPETMSTLLLNATPNLPNIGRQEFPGLDGVCNQSNDLYPQQGNPPQGWSIAGMLNLHPDASTGRHKNSVWWAGIANCYWWLDHDTGIGGILVAQVLPFLDPKIRNVAKKIERAVYDSLG